MNLSQKVSFYVILEKAVAWHYFFPFIYTILKWYLGEHIRGSMTDVGKCPYLLEVNAQMKVKCQMPIIFKKCFSNIICMCM